MQALTISHVSKQFKVEQTLINALKDITLSIDEGEIFGILGPNGAGKTTLLNTINGLLIQDAGSVLVFGKPLQRNMHLLEQMNYVSGESRFHWCLTPPQILKFYAMLYNVPRAERDNRISRLIDTFEIRPFITQRFDSLSTGQRMRIVLAKALINNPRLLLLDEPTLGLDPDIAIKVRSLIQKINKEQGTTIIITSHYMGEVEQLCRRIAFINKGELVDVGEVEHVKHRKFSEYEVTIDLKAATDPAFLRTLGGLKGKTLIVSMPTDEDISELIATLVKRGYAIIDVRSRKPSLEDYFVKILGAA